MAQNNPSRYSIQGRDFIKQHGITDITVFIREPIDRAMSAFATQMDIYGIAPEILETIMIEHRIIPLIDLHIIPQFWHLLDLANEYKELKFNLLPLAELNQVDASIEHLYKRSVRMPTLKLNLTEPVINRLIHLLTEDIVLYNQFVNSTATIDEIIEKIKLETNFVNDIRSYQRELTYLL